MKPKEMYPVVLSRHFTTVHHLEFQHEGEMHQVEVSRVDELEDALSAIGQAAGIPQDQLFVTANYSIDEVMLLTDATKKEFCNFHIEAALRLRAALGYSNSDFDLLMLLNGAKIRIERYEKRLKELGEKLDPF